MQAETRLAAAAAAVPALALAPATSLADVVVLNCSSA
jgi:hypothetical protein